ncbi:hypothetical protein V498_08439 [Pseudogymnoascus sp. VKM F-4517 (FW-2822)]|nr:hypothetical protein V498_08439 [Pseudogymnoascus sp. VKM F-4517 (FW-2822)]
MFSDSMSDSDLDKKMVYLAYRDIFKDKLAKLRKRNKVRNVVEKHKDHLHHKQVADSMDLEKTCRILGDLLAARLFESESAAKATFPTLFSPRELGNDSALIAKCVEDSFEAGCGQRDGTNPDALPFLSPDTRMPNVAFPESAPTARQHRIDRKWERVRKPTRATTKPTGSMVQVGEGQEALSKENSRKRISTSLPNNLCRSVNADYIYLCRQSDG